MKSILMGKLEKVWEGQHIARKIKPIEVAWREKGVRLIDT